MRPIETKAGKTGMETWRYFTCATCGGIDTVEVVQTAAGGVYRRCTRCPAFDDFIVVKKPSKGNK